MKRIIPIFLVFVLSLTCLVAPVSASSFDVPDTSFSVLDYCTPNDNFSTDVAINGSGSVNFNLPNGLLFNYVDIVFTSTPNDPTSVKLGNSLTLVPLSAGVFRAYGTIPYTYYDEFNLDFVTSGDVLINFLSFNAFNTSLTPKGLLGQAVFYMNGTAVSAKQMSSPSSTVTYTFAVNNDSSGNDTCIIDLECLNHEGYDQIAFRFRTALNITSIIGMSEDGQYPIPLTVSTFNDSLSSNDGVYYYCILDVSNLPNLPSIRPIVQVNGNKPVNKSYSFNFYDCVGFVNVDYIDPELHLLRRLRINLETWFSDLQTGIVNALDNVQYQLKQSISSFRSDVLKSHQQIKDYLSSIASGSRYKDEADSFNDSVTDQSQELEDMTSIMGSVEKPDINNIDFNPSTMVDTNTLVLATSGLSNVLGNQIIIRILLMALTFALVGFVLYGKK